MVQDLSKPTRTTRYPVAIVAKARSLYVVKGLGPTEVAERLNITSDTVSQWACKQGWREERDKRAEKLVQRVALRESDENAAFLASLADQTEELAEDSMQIARDAVAKGLSATRELQQSSQSLKNFVDVYFKAQGLDAKGQSIDVRAELVFRLPGDNAVNVTPPNAETTQDAEPKQLKG